MPSGQGGRRRGRIWVCLQVSIPIFCPLSVPSDKGVSIISICPWDLTGIFSDALLSGREYGSVNPRNQEISETIAPGDLWDAVARAAWSSGDPGMLFFDRINEKNTVPGLGPLEATNPCGEQPLLPFESCNFASINLSQFSQKGTLTRKNSGNGQPFGAVHQRSHRCNLVSYQKGQGSDGSDPEDWAWHNGTSRFTDQARCSLILQTKDCRYCRTDYVGYTGRGKTGVL